MTGIDSILGDLNLEKKQKKQSKATDALNVLSKLSGARKTEIYLPILKTRVIMSPFSGAEDLYLQTLKVSGSTFHRYTDEMLYQQAEFLDLGFSSFDDFLNNITPIDKSVMFVGLLQATFNELPEKIIACPKCGKSDTYAFSPEQLVHPDTYPKVWDKEEDARHYEVTNELVPGVFITYGMPYEGLKLEVLSSNSSEDMRNNLEKHKDVLNLVDFMALYIRKMVIKSEGSEDIVMTNMKEDILPTVKNMPLDLQVKLIDDSTIDVFTEYNPYYYINIDCGNPACNHKFKWDDIKPENDFFRKALSLYNA